MRAKSKKKKAVTVHAPDAPIALVELKRRIRGLPPDVQRKSVCALVGHSLIVEACFWYITCARCGAQVGDKLMGGYSQAERCVQIGHNCTTCRKNYAALDWRSKFLAPNPFSKPGRDVGGVR